MNDSFEVHAARTGVNLGAMRREGRILLIGCAPPSELARLGLEPSAVEWVLLTHHHRNVAEGLGELVALGAKPAVPEAERVLFERAHERWANDAFRIHAYHYHPSTRTLREDVPVAHGLTHGERFLWRGAAIECLATPGPSSGGMSFLIREADTTRAFVGELICGGGKLRDFHLLQGRRPVKDGELMEYHGFGERASDVVRSLETVMAHNPTELVPSAGSIVRRPAGAAAALRSRVESCMRSYHSISACRWHFPGAWPDAPDVIADLRKRCRPLPKWVVEIGGTSRLVMAADRSGLLIDCAGDVPERIAAMRADGRLGRVEELWITHYHDDHVQHVNVLREREGCSVLAHHTMDAILRSPESYCLPCLDPNPIVPDRVTEHAESWMWHDMKLTAFDLQGQTLYDAALLVERGSERVLFVGDSFTPGGLDDYCAQNRNLLGKRIGFDRSLALLEDLGPDVLLVNEHVPGAFVFSSAEVREMRRVLDERRRLFAELLDWDDPNFGLDPLWVRLEPYYRKAPAGKPVEWAVCIHNHSATDRRFRVELRVPKGWRAVRGAAALKLSGGRQGRAALSAIPDAETRGRCVIGLSVSIERRMLGDIAEAIVDLA